MREEEFTRELASLLNRTSAENGSNTPDFVLADYLRTCLRALDEAINARSKWYGRSDSPGSGAALTPPGHVLVGPDARERIAAVVQAAHEWRTERAAYASDPRLSCRRLGEAGDSIETALSALTPEDRAALGVRGGA